MNESLDSQYPQFVRVILSENVHCNQNCHGNVLYVRQRNINRAVQPAASPSRNTSQTVSRVQIQSGISTQSRSRSQNRVSNQRGRDIEPIVSPDVRRQSALSPTRPNQGNRLRERITSHVVDLLFVHFEENFE
jgi:hypothetical protein